jgi:hypothetical protein
MDPLAQAAGQVHCINKAVELGMATVADERKLIVDYEEFCANPKRIYDRLWKKLGNVGVDYVGPESFSRSRAVKADSRQLIEAALMKFGRR